MLIPRCYFDAERCRLGTDHLAKYGVNFNEGTGVYAKQPKDNEHSHAADAFMVGAVADDMGYFEDDEDWHYRQSHDQRGPMVYGTMGTRR